MKHIVKYYKDKEVNKVELVNTKQEALKKKNSYLKSFHITQRVKENRQSTISKA